LSGGNKRPGDEPGQEGRMKVFIKKGLVELKTGPKGQYIEFGPDTEGPNVRMIQVGLKVALPETNPDEDYLCIKAKVFKFQSEGQKRPFFVLAPDDGEPDNRALVISEFYRAAHRENTGIDKDLTTAKVLDSTYGYGAFGSGVAFIAVLAPGERVCSDYEKVRIISYDGDNISVETVPRDLLLAEERGGQVGLVL
jgi:hypothetical protein